MGATYGRIRSLVEAPTAADRRMIREATAATAAPTDRRQFRHAQGGRWLHLYANISGLSALSVRIWYYSDIAEKLFAGPIVDLFAAGGRHAEEIIGEDLVHIQVTTVTGGNVDLWAGVNFGGN